jgi:iron complex transport system substrate-binding protein
VCLTEETTETLYLLGVEDRIIGVSGYTSRPPSARQKPRVSAFTTAKIDRILDLNPDLIIGFSNLQADIARDLIRAGKTVLITNQRSVDEIFETISMIGSLVGAQTRAANLIDRLKVGLDNIAVAARRFPIRPRVLFEEWMNPLISGIRWVEELIEVAGGQPIFPELRFEHDAARRIIDPAIVPSRDPQVIIASWCGRKVNKTMISERAGWEDVSAVRAGHIYEVKSTYILQPGPAALTEGVKQLHAILSVVNGEDVPAEIAPEERTDPALLIRPIQDCLGQ